MGSPFRRADIRMSHPAAGTRPPGRSALLLILLRNGAAGSCGKSFQIRSVWEQTDRLFPGRGRRIRFSVSALRSRSQIPAGIPGDADRLREFLRSSAISPEMNTVRLNFRAACSKSRSSEVFIRTDCNGSPWEFLLVRSSRHRHLFRKRNLSRRAENESDSVSSAGPFNSHRVCSCPPPRFCGTSRHQIENRCRNWPDLRFSSPLFSPPPSEAHSIRMYQSAPSLRIPWIHAQNTEDRRAEETDSPRRSKPLKQADLFVPTYSELLLRPADFVLSCWKALYFQASYGILEVSDSVRFCPGSGPGPGDSPFCDIICCV